jgi:hypothetical protein
MGEAGRGSIIRPVFGDQFGLLEDGLGGLFLFVGRRHLCLVPPAVAVRRPAYGAGLAQAGMPPERNPAGTKPAGQPGEIARTCPLGAAGVRGKRLEHLVMYSCFLAYLPQCR